MLDLTFGEQVKIVLSRKGMTIKELAELIEESTGMKMSRQNLTQRLSRDNFQEQDMRMIAAILERPIHLSILEDDGPISELPRKKVEEKSEKTEEKQKTENVVPEPVIEEPEEVFEQEEMAEPVEDMDYIDVESIEDIEDAESEETEETEEKAYSVDELLAEIDALEAETRAVQEDAPVMKKKEKSRGWEFPLHRKKQVQPEEVAVEDVIHEDVLVEDVLQETLDEEEDTELGDVNPYTGREYKTNSVRVHPDRIGYVQVYDRGEHKWTDMTEWAFLGYQERKKALLGKDYEPPIYLD